MVRHQPQHRLRPARQHREPAVPARCSPTSCASAATPTGCSPTPTIDDMTLDQLIAREGYSETFADWYLIPMGDAIWSTPPDMLRDYPAGTFLRFCDNHGLLHITGKPMWRSVIDGSRTYVEAAARSFSGEVFTAEPVDRRRAARRWRRPGDHRRALARLRRRGARDARARLARHARRRLARSSARFSARSASGATRSRCTPTQSFMPKSRRAWASWNWYSETTGATKEMLTLTYWLNNLQKMPDGAPAVFETLNPHKDYAEGTILERMDFEHPMFSAEAVAAQKRVRRDPGRRRRLVRGRLAALRLPRGRAALGGARRRGARRDAAVGRGARREPHARARCPRPSPAQCAPPAPRAAARRRHRSRRREQPALHRLRRAHARSAQEERVPLPGLLPLPRPRRARRARRARSPSSRTTAARSLVPRRRPRPARRLAAAAVDRRAARRARTSTSPAGASASSPSRACSASGSTRSRSGTASTPTARRARCSPRSTTPSATTTTTCCTTTATSSTGTRARPPRRSSRCRRSSRWMPATSSPSPSRATSSTWPSATSSRARFSSRTSLQLTAEPLTDAGISRVVRRFGPISARAWVLIHLQAIRIVSKGIRYIPPSPDPEEETT